MKTNKSKNLLVEGFSAYKKQNQKYYGGYFLTSDLIIMSALWSFPGLNIP